MTSNPPINTPSTLILFTTSLQSKERKKGEGKSLRIFLEERGGRGGRASPVSHENEGKPL